MYLSDEDFVGMFKMSKAQFSGNFPLPITPIMLFSALPAWKKKQKKQEFNLF